MKVVVTGGSGFLGQRLIRALCERGRLTDAAGRERAIERIVAVDQGRCDEPVTDGRLVYALGDVADASFIAGVLGADTGSVFHLAAVVSGAAERDFDLGMRVNLDGSRLPKHHHRIHAYGTVDELSCVLGLALANGVEERLHGLLRSIQNDLFDVGADLCTPVVQDPEYPPLRVEPDYVERLERACDEYNERSVRCRCQASR